MDTEWENWEYKETGSLKINKDQIPNQNRHSRRIVKARFAKAFFAFIRLVGQLKNFEGSNKQKKHKNYKCKS